MHILIDHAVRHVGNNDGISTEEASDIRTVNVICCAKGSINLTYTNTCQVSQVDIDQNTARKKVKNRDNK